MSPSFDPRPVALGAMGFFWGGLTAPLAIRLAQLYEILDVPDVRKIHTSHMPRGGGLGLWSGYMLLALYLGQEMPMMRLTATGATMVFLCGYMDDMRSLSPFLRLALHFIASAMAVLPLGLPPVSALMAVVWVAGTTSAYNLIDGMNGLCLSLFIASCAALCWLRAAPVGACMGAMALGVLCWNFPSAQTFLGDGGSTLLGYLFASHFVTAALPRLPGIPIHETILLLLLFGGAPVLDTMVAFCRRILRGKSPFYPDKGHLHHVLMSSTGSPLLAVCVLLALHALCLGGGLAAWARLLRP